MGIWKTNSNTETQKHKGKSYDEQEELHKILINNHNFL